MRDGWHKVKGFTVYVENERIIRGVEKGKTTYPYYFYKGQYNNVVGVGVNSFRRSKYMTMK